MTRRKFGIGLVVVAYVLLLYISVSTVAFARAHPHFDPVLLSQYAGPWPLAVVGAVALAGIMLAVVPLRQGESWALWTSLAILGILFATRMATDPRCRVVLDPHQHGCHTFMIAMIVGLLGLVLARK